ncbi:MAG: DNA-directed RNA polymerase subunit beta [Candidatus Doudnabacteria bacterium]|nr:DNA-directed RNA polymerase subunit beta [Candidatus Doudnabacteria bacterium]
MTAINRISLAKRPIKNLDINLLDAQLDSFADFKDTGFYELFDEVNPITDYTNSSWELIFEDFSWDDPKHSFREAQKLGLSYDAPVHMHVKLINKRTGEIKKQKIFLADMPLMGERGSFMVSGNERVVVLQILRSEGLLFVESKASKPKKRLYTVKLMPLRGKWFDFEVNKYGVMSVKLLEKHPKILLTTLLRALGYSSNDQIRKVLEDVDNGEVSFVDATLKKDPSHNTDEALIEIYRKLRPEDSVTIENAREFIEGLFFNKRRFFLGKVGRYKLNKKLNIDKDITPADYLLNREDIVQIVRALIEVNNGRRPVDDIDSLINRRIRGVGELIADKIRVGVLRMEKNIKDRMSLYSTDDNITPSMLINTRPVIAAINQFFGGSALSRFMDQQNVLSEIETKRRITAGGPRGLTKERATFSVRDVHNSHYSKICPVNTPEGPSIGVVMHMSVFSRLNDFGFLEAPYMKVVNKFKIGQDKLADFKGRAIWSDLHDDKGKVIAKKGDELSDSLVKAADKAGLTEIKIVPFVTDEVVYLDAETELRYKIASGSVHTDAKGNMLEDKTYVRDGRTYLKVEVSEVDLVDVSPAQIGGLGLSLIPFASMDDPNRTLIGSKTQTQAVPLLRQDPPIVGTGFEKVAAKATGRNVYAEAEGVVSYADADKVIVEYTPAKGKKYKKEYEIETFSRTNQSTSFSQTPAVKRGDKIEEGQVIINAPCTANGEIALGANLRTAYIVYDGYNYEDGIVISERLLKEDVLTSVHIYEYTQEIRETKLGDEQITRDIPNVGEHALRNLDEGGVVRVGAHVEPNDILVGIIAPKGETELSAEEKLLRAIFGDYARDVRDNSLRLPHGDRGVVVSVQILDKNTGAKLNPGVIKQVKVWVAKTHKISVGDKLTGYHGDKGVITKILPQEDMPYTADGEPVDIIVGPGSMVRRMNVGQLMEAHIGALAAKLGVRVEIPPFTDYDTAPLMDMAKKAGVDYEEKVALFDGRTGQPYDQKVTVGPRYFFKLEHLADHKVHARSTGPYTMVTQQPLGGKAQRGGQRFGEMEVWALEAHGVPYVLHEMLTIKSDDLVGRSAAYKSIITGQDVTVPSVPESFNVFDRELAALCVKLEKIGAVVDPFIENASLDEIVDSIGENTPAADQAQVVAELESPEGGFEVNEGTDEAAV